MAGVASGIRTFMVTRLAKRQVLAEENYNAWMPRHHLAQINIGRLIAPIDDPRISGFVQQLDAINRLADDSPGFVWRLQSEQGNATDVAYNGDPSILVNMSVWESVEALQAYVYKSNHVAVLRDRQKWFAKLNVPHYCLWWIPAGHITNVAEGRARLEHYQRHGASPEAFWFADKYLAPEFAAM